MNDIRKQVLFFTTSLLISLVFATSISAFAQDEQAPAAPGAEAQIDARQKMQQERIADGVNSGQLTPAEAARLEKREAHIENMEKRAQADGTVTKKEAHRIKHAQNRASRKIHHKKHNRHHN